jgi:hypothetical protein
MEHSSREMASLQGEHRLTEQELACVRHALDAEVLGLKKCLHYSQEMGDEQARHLLEEHADIHHRRIDMMLSLLDAPGDITKHAKMLLQNGRPQGGHANA